MSSTTTTRLALVKPTPGTSEPVNIATQLNTNWDKVDSSIGAIPCTEATKPASPYDGMIIRTTDTRRLYVWNATQANWDQVMSVGSSFTTPGGGSTASVRLYTTGTASNNRALAVRGSGDTQDHWWVDHDGAMQWSTGAAAADVGLSRIAANTIGTGSGQHVQVGGNLTVNGVGQMRTVVKSADESISNSITPQNDDDLSMSVVANATYIFLALLHQTLGGTTVDIRIDFAYPTGCTLHEGGIGPAAALTGTAGTGEFVSRLGNVSTQSTDTIYGSDSTPTSILKGGVLIVGGTAGTFNLRFAQGATHATAITMKEGSFLWMHRIA